ncbi:YgjV family protein [Nocardioides humilatus]|uniref:YgjV family protein n=1 Tax=Nocardioides humilatus TaxID=2607660 RepID=A0A5B1LCH9_9ACTN|nr:YgjV family protein [Nocardioides humilatus]KAA1417984.1 YgjV family protein [Nocardioides humilatus]
MDWIDALGWGGSALLVYSLLQRRVLRFRTLNLVAGAVLIAFNVIIAVWPMVALNVVTSGINLWFIVQLRRQRHDAGSFGVIEVGLDDQYLHHVLDTHADDIREHQPTFPGRAVAGQEAFVVVKGDETVGVVVIERDGVTAQIRLDYVTPRYRDFTPGEFVWRRSDLLRGRGYHRVRTSPEIVAPYYGEIGFRREGDGFVLDLA